MRCQHDSDRAMSQNVKIIELSKDQTSSLGLHYKYVTSEYYDLVFKHEKDSWRIELIRKSLDESIEKNSDSSLFQSFVEEPRVFAVEMNNEQIGWLELGYEKWNNRMRVWEILVKEGFRRQGIGTVLMNKAVDIAKEKGARMLVLETQSCNVNAISFYLKLGFELVGLDAAAYSNEDLQKREVRLEMGKKLI
jgi:ribosomal protein S18 acetylase RimI-like enzyme